jgi:hypothetical protein
METLRCTCSIDDLSTTTSATDGARQTMDLTADVLGREFGDVETVGRP